METPTNIRTVIPQRKFYIDFTLWQELVTPEPVITPKAKNDSVTGTTSTINDDEHSSRGSRSSMTSIPENKVTRENALKNGNVTQPNTSSRSGHQNQSERNDFMRSFSGPCGIHKEAILLYMAKKKQEQCEKKLNHLNRFFDLRSLVHSTPKQYASTSSSQASFPSA